MTSASLTMLSEQLFVGVGIRRPRRPLWPGGLASADPFAALVPTWAPTLFSSSSTEAVALSSARRRRRAADSLNLTSAYSCLRRTSCRGGFRWDVKSQEAELAAVRPRLESTSLGHWLTLSPTPHPLTCPL